MPEKLISVDEYLSKRKSCASDKGIVYKAFKSPRSWNPEERSATFIMSTESVDRHGDVVVQAGMDIDKFMENPVALMNHRSDMPIGLWSDVKKVTGKPRRTEGKMTLLPEGADPNADRAAAHISFGTMKTASIGFRAKSIETIRDDEGRWTGYKIMESELMECSLVTIPAQAEAIAKAMDDGDTVLAKALIEEVLDNWALDPTSGLIVPREQFEKSYAVVKNLSGRPLGEKTFVVGGVEATVPDVDQVCVAAVEKALSEEPAKKTITSIIHDLLAKAGLVSRPVSDTKEIEEASPEPSQATEPASEKSADPEPDQNSDEDAARKRRASIARAKAALAVSQSVEKLG